MRPILATAALLGLLGGTFTSAAAADTTAPQQVMAELDIQVPGHLPFQPRVMLQVGQSATLQRLSANGEGLRLQLLATRVQVDAQGRRIVELESELQAVGASESHTLSTLHTAVVLDAPEPARFHQASAEHGTQVEMTLRTSSPLRPATAAPKP